MANLGREQMLMMLEKRLAAVEAALKITPAPETVINARFGKAATPKTQTRRKK